MYTHVKKVHPHHVDTTHKCKQSETPRNTTIHNQTSRQQTGAHTRTMLSLSCRNPPHLIWDSKGQRQNAPKKTY